MAVVFSCFFFNDTATTEIYTLSLHDALPISREASNSSYHEQTSIGSDNIIGRDNEVEESLPDGHVDAGDHHSVDECSQDGEWFASHILNHGK